MRTIIRYIRLYGMFLRYSIQSELAYPGNFVVCLMVEFMYQASFYAYYAVILSKSPTIAGWGIGEMMILIGIGTAANELLTAMVVVWNTRELPYKIWNGELDRILLRPMNPLFMVTLGRPYFPAILSVLSGLTLIVLGMVRTGIHPSFVSLLGAIIFFVSGFAITYAIVTMFSLLTFYFQDTWTMTRIGEQLTFSFTSRPHLIFTGVLKVIFYFIVPVVYVSSFPASTLISGVDWKYLGIAVTLAMGFMVMTKTMWDNAIKGYSSASS